MGEMRVSLGRRHARVTQDALDSANRDAAHDVESGTRVTQIVEANTRATCEHEMLDEASSPLEAATSLPMHGWEHETLARPGARLLPVRKHLS